MHADLASHPYMDVFFAVVRQEHWGDFYERYWICVRRYDPTRGSFLKLLSRAYSNWRKDLLRRDRVRACVSIERSPDIGGPAWAGDDEDIGQLRERVGALKMEQWELMQMVHCRGATCAQAANAVGIPSGTVRTRMFAARNKIRSGVSA